MAFGEADAAIFDRPLNVLGVDAVIRERAVNVEGFTR